MLSLVVGVIVNCSHSCLKDLPVSNKPDTNMEYEMARNQMHVESNCKQPSRTPPSVHLDCWQTRICNTWPKRFLPLNRNQVLQQLFILDTQKHPLDGSVNPMMSLPQMKEQTHRIWTCHVSWQTLDLGSDIMAQIAHPKEFHNAWSCWGSSDNLQTAQNVEGLTDPFRCLSKTAM